MEREVPIRGQVIRLGQLLKLADVIASGAEVKAFLARRPVWVNGELEARRGRQLFPGDVVRIGELELRLAAADPGEPQVRPRPAEPDEP
jgi:ribosome-associated protein